MRLMVAGFRSDGGRLLEPITTVEELVDLVTWLGGEAHFSQLSQPTAEFKDLSVVMIRSVPNPPPVRKGSGGSGGEVDRPTRGL